MSLEAVHEIFFISLDIKWCLCYSRRSIYSHVYVCTRVYVSTHAHMGCGLGIILLPVRDTLSGTIFVVRHHSFLLLKSESKWLKVIAVYRELSLHIDL